MNLNDVIQKIDYFLNLLIKGLSFIAVASLVIMVLIVVANVVGRYLFSKPIIGTIEIVGLLTVIVVFCVFAFAESQGAHIAVTIISTKIYGVKKIIITSLIFFLGTFFFTLMGWQGLVLMKTNLYPTIRTSSILSIPFAPFMFVMAFGCFIFSLELLIHGFKTISSSKRDSKE
jgi:TRAP-type C4-dicarboxylate transport system permease small subunit